MTNKIISFPRLGNYHYPISFLLSKLTNHQIMEPLPITKKTLLLGAKYSPEFVCAPFKYNLGNYLESLERGANILIQAGGGCRYGYYAEVQQLILKDLGYQFTFYNLTSNHKSLLPHLYNTFKQLNPKITILKFFYYFVLSLKMICYLDKISIYIRKNSGFEVKKHSFDSLFKEMLNNFKKTRGFFHLFKLYRKYNKEFRKIKLDKPKDCLKVGVIGELYTAMEEASNYYLEQFLINMKIEIDRYTDLTYLLISKRFNLKRLLKICNGYCKYPIGADGLDNIAMTKVLAKKGYDGLIHLKSFGCTPEVGAISIIEKVARDYKIPIIYLSFDSHPNEEAIKTRLEAFYDMIKMRREKDD